jgi:hypothetical protein
MKQISRDKIKNQDDLQEMEVVMLFKSHYKESLSNYGHSGTDILLLIDDKILLSVYK